MDRLVQLLEKMQVPFAYDHFAEGESPEPPFLVYLFPRSANFPGDGQVYYKQTQVAVELYTDAKDLFREHQLEQLLDQAGIYYEKSEVWIPSERLYEVRYEFIWEVDYEE